MVTPIASTLVVMPAFNEEAAVGDVVREVHAKVPEVDVVVVNDGSRDRTARAAREAGARVLDLPFNLGVGGAMRAGFRYAQREGYDYVVQVDADGQHDPVGVRSIVAQLQHSDVVIGSRFEGAGEYAVHGVRRFVMRVLSWCISRIARTTLTDTTSGFRGSGPRAIAYFADHYPAEYLGDTIESLVMAAKAGLTITQLPVAMRPRAGGVPSHNPLKAGIFLARAMLALLVALARPRAAAPIEDATA
ncbi:glycosyltransferase family 2 protein [Pseudoclavibacter endophyticus]|uniref:Glycosyltransferase family 2 protein n=1 Tax=Pseudoclavibacter endophyticus TaxID=1778590 RepID=A0A6H9WN40_9MICO|nr:glycosyltransferase family 2 protein [Pseudoclavibacter endophyticus]KAB1649121.1 glycosyltransferase family 2 protein [Pseudoclavibacter endophyticus]